MNLLSNQQNLKYVIYFPPYVVLIFWETPESDPELELFRDGRIEMLDHLERNVTGNRFCSEFNQRMQLDI